MPIVDVDRLKEQGKRFVDGFTPGQKAMTILGVVAVVLAGMSFMKWASSTDYAPLYTGLSGPDAGTVTQKLDAAGVKYKLAGGGGTILVSKNDVYKERVALSAQGMPPAAATRSRCSTSRASPPTSSRATSTTSARCRASSARRSSRSTASGGDRDDPRSRRRPSSSAPTRTRRPRPCS